MTSPHTSKSRHEVISEILSINLNSKSAISTQSYKNSDFFFLGGGEGWGRKEVGSQYAYFFSGLQGNGWLYPM